MCYLHVIFWTCWCCTCEFIRLWIHLLVKLFLLVNHLLYFLAVKLHNGFGRWTVYDFFWHSYMFSESYAHFTWDIILLFCGCHLLKALLWGLWIALFISPLLSLLCTLLCQYCHVLVSHLLCEKNYLWPGLVPILQFTFGQFFCPDCSLPVSVDGHLLVNSSTAKTAT